MSGLGSRKIVSSNCKELLIDDSEVQTVVLPEDHIEENDIFVYAKGQQRIKGPLLVEGHAIFVGHLIIED